LNSELPAGGHIALVVGENEVAAAGDGGFQNKVVIWVRSEGTPKDVLAMQGSLRQDAVEHVVDIRIHEAKGTNLSL
jgi:hypothetical protein